MSEQQRDLDVLAARLYLADRERPPATLAFIDQTHDVQERYRQMAKVAEHHFRLRERGIQRLKDAATTPAETGGGQ